MPEYKSINSKCASIICEAYMFAGVSIGFNLCQQRNLTIFPNYETVFVNV